MADIVDRLNLAAHDLRSEDRQALADLLAEAAETITKLRLDNSLLGLAKLDKSQSYAEITKDLRRSPDKP